MRTLLFRIQKIAKEKVVERKQGEIQAAFLGYSVMWLIAIGLARSDNELKLFMFYFILTVFLWYLVFRYGGKNEQGI